MFYHPNVTNADQVEARIDGLYQDPRCSGMAGEGTLTIHRLKGQNVFVARVSINKQKPGRFIVDTGATLLTLDRAFAEASGIQTIGQPELLLRTVNGVTRGTFTRVEEVNLGGASVRRVEAVVIDSVAPGFDGLLGLSVLNRFSVHLEPGEETLVLVKRPRANHSAPPHVPPM